MCLKCGIINHKESMMSENETTVAMTDEEQRTAAKKIVETFEQFSEAYDRYVDKMDRLVSSIEPDAPLHKKARFLITGLDGVAMFMLTAKGVASNQVAPFLRNP